MINEEYISNQFQIGIEKLINESFLDAKMGISDYKLAYIICEIIGSNLAAMHAFDSYKRGSFIEALKDARQSLIDGHVSLPSKAIHGLDAVMLSMRSCLPNPEDRRAAPAPMPQNTPFNPRASSGDLSGRAT